MTRILALLASSLLCTPAFADVHVVAPSGGDFTTIQAAVSAALDGDTVLVRPGTYAGFTVNAKSIAVVGDGSVVVVDPIVVQGLASGQTCSLASLSSDLPSTFAAPPARSALVIQAVAGSVRVRDCVLRGANGNLARPGHHGVRISASSGDVAFAACTIEGGRAGSYQTEFAHGEAAGLGLSIAGGRLALHDCFVAGGRGGNTAYGVAADGGHAIAIDAGSVALSGIFVCGSQFVGGRGGDSYEDALPFNVFPGDGGTGLFVGSGVVAQVRDASLQGGAPGVGVLCAPDVPPVAGAPSSGAGTIYTLSAPRVTLETAPIVRDGASLALQVRGVPGALACLDIGRAPRFHPVPSFGGIVLVLNPAPSKTLVLGTIPWTGVLSLTLPIPEQGPSFLEDQRHLQAYTVDAQGARSLGSFAVLTVVDAAY